MAGVSDIGIIAAFLGGLVSFISPCVLPLVPGYISYVAGEELGDLATEGLTRRRLSALLLAGFFVLGFSAVFITLGASASAIGEFLLVRRYELNLAAGAVVILFGLYLMGLLRLGWINREMRFGQRLAGGHPAGAFLLGVAFAFGWTPCIGPVLGVVLTMSATQETIGGGVVLLAFYSLGLGIPFLCVAAFTGWFMRRVRVLARTSRAIQIVAGAVLVLMGIAMITGWLSSFAFWILEGLPFLAEIG
jgi:cytochrome c-type biogenesis protein